MAGLCEGGNEPSGSLKAICKHHDDDDDDDDDDDLQYVNRSVESTSACINVQYDYLVLTVAGNLRLGQASPLSYAMGCSVTNGAPRPNIILIVADDLSTGCHWYFKANLGRIRRDGKNIEAGTADSFSSPEKSQPKKKIVAPVDSFDEEHVMLQDDARPGQAQRSITSAVIAEVYGLIRGNRRITVEELRRLVGISHGSVHVIATKHLQYRKFYAQWVPHQ
ncbi:hypothetical protein ANN_24884 [Periplaneta americana]|uniref:Uncharacterized protein n=1 Tax=Periplaneta americana TaxID=6978 RepID=A0ABQ8S0H2_PERAM|nr:hypothetical protein ANN_24884 [Periplaneta americana]